MVSLSLFKTLLSLNCEDVMLQLVLRYVCAPLLVSATHVSRETELALFESELCCVGARVRVPSRYLLPCTHVMQSQRRAIRETDIYGKSADKFLSLIPDCCRTYTAATAAERDDDGAFRGKGEWRRLGGVQLCPRFPC